jgi:eukaryotic-like serine/threonine-protein kinase
MGKKWSRSKDLFNAALELEPGKRAAFLEQACAGDSELRAEIESLLAFHSETQERKPRADPDATETWESTDARPLTEQHVGPYQLIRQIGRGGMAVVYLAMRADAEYRKRVAIKLLRQGMDEEILRRFRNERQTLAALDHPNIVKLLDGGSTPEGWPYLVMEYVEGIPINQYCDTKRLTIAERLGLFCTVCDAVHYAHQNLVIHRDLKPSNILVTPAGTPKLLDFGIAKLLNPEFSAHTLLVTQPGSWVMTPEYASPEQIRGLPINTATDVYSLGVMLYELLSGNRPYRLHTGTPLELERAICEDEPEAPSTAINRKQESGTDSSITVEAAGRTGGSVEKLRRQLSGDLDNIVLTALRKEPQRRYASVLQLSDDVRRHLEGLPITARPATLAYRSSKFVQRNRGAVIAAALIIATLAVGLAVATWEAHVARRQRALAEARFNDLHQLADSFLFDFDNAIKDLRGSTPARSLIVRKALEYLNRLSEGAGNSPTLQEDLAHAYIKVGDIQGGPAASNLGDLKGALDSYSKAQKIAGALHSSRPANGTDLELLATTYLRMGGALPFAGKPRDAVESLNQAVLLLKQLVGNGSQDLPVQLDLIDCYTELGDAYGHGSVLNLGEPDKALEYFREALTLARKTLDAYPGNAGVLRRIAIAESKEGDIFLARGDLNDAASYHQKSLDDFAAIASRDPNNGRAKRELSAAYNRLGETLLQQGDRPKSLASFKNALSISEDLFAADPTDAEAKFDLAVALRNLSEAQVATKNLPGAVDSFRRAIVLVSELCEAHPTNLGRKAQLAEGLVSFGQLLTQAGHTEEARRETSRGLEMQRGLAEAPGATQDEVLTYANQLLTCEPAQLRDPATALRFAQRAAGVDAKDPNVLNLLASAYFAVGDPTHAVATEEQALALLRERPDAASSSSFEKQIALNLEKYKKASNSAEK